MIIIASLNPHKIAEIRTLPAASGIGLKAISSFDGATPVEEKGATCEENAALKAVRQSLWLKRAHGLQTPVIAEDSGLHVEAMLGWPGVDSARIADTDQERINLVLDGLKDKVSRSANFVAYTALAINGHLLRTWRGIAQGRITQSPRGSGGFGYDPIFEDEDLGLTFGELSTEQKTKRSHRTKAWVKALEYVRAEHLAQDC